MRAAASCLVWTVACAGAGEEVRREPAEPVEVREPVSTFRLSKKVEPLGYRVRLEVDPEEAQLSGTVKVRVRLEEALGKIWLHADGLEVRRAVVRAEGRTIRPVVVRAPAQEQIGIDWAGALGPGTVLLTIDYEGTVREERGLFRPDGSVEAVFTQMQPISARRVLPCFDEPRFRTPWELSLVVPEETVAVSNMPRAGGEELGGGEKLVRFGESPPMPSYLLAFAVGDFQIVEGPEEPFPLRALLPAGAEVDGVEARLGAVAELYEILEAYLGPPFELEKLDLVAVPEFSIGAMENPGLFTFHQELFAGEYAENFEGTAAHELVHLWFGDLVTFAWWNDFWLSEAFAWWLASAATHARSEGKALDPMEAHRTILRSRRRLTKAQIQVSSHEDIRLIWARKGDPIGWQEALSMGKAVLQRLARALGSEGTREVLRRYLAENRYGTASLEDFVEAVEAVAGEERARFLLGR